MSGIETGFNTFITAMSIAYGLMLSSVILPRRFTARRGARSGACVAGRDWSRSSERSAVPAPTADRVAGVGVLVAASVSALVVNANTSAVTILLPTMSEDVGTPVAELQWAVTGYMLVGAAVIVTSGALGDVLGRRRVFLGGLALFIASCVSSRCRTAARGSSSGA